MNVVNHQNLLPLSPEQEKALGYALSTLPEDVELGGRVNKTMMALNRQQQVYKVEFRFVYVLGGWAVISMTAPEIVD